MKRTWKTLIDKLRHGDITKTITFSLAWLLKLCKCDQWGNYINTYPHIFI